MKTIAQQLNIKDFPFKIKDKQGNLLYEEFEEGYWGKWEFDSLGNRIYYEASDGFWNKWEFDSLGNRIYFKDSRGFWAKYEYDSEGNKIYYEASDGVLIDNRPKLDTTHSEDWNELVYGSAGKKVYHINTDAETKPDDVITLNGKKYKRIDQ